LFNDGTDPTGLFMEGVKHALDWATGNRPEFGEMIADLRATTKRHVERN